MINGNDATLVNVVRQVLYTIWRQHLNSDLNVEKIQSHDDSKSNDSRKEKANNIECSYSYQCIEETSAVKMLSNSLSKYTESNLTLVLSLKKTHSQL